VNVAELRTLMADELACRRIADREDSFADARGGPETLYGLIGAVHVRAALGLPLGTRALRAGWAQRILGYRDAAGHFSGAESAGHAVHMALGALNLLGEPIPRDIGPLAPTDPAALAEWLERHDWESTHKDLCGQTIPLLASGRVSAAWTEVFVRHLADRLRPASPLATWCRPDAPPWQVISSLYHVLSAFDAGRLPYPQPELLMGRLRELRWESAPESAHRTICTDSDWAWMLLRLCEQVPRHLEAVMPAIRQVSARRVAAWHAGGMALARTSTFHLYCFLWGTAVFQSCVREHFTGGYLRDTLNDPALFRL